MMTLPNTDSLTNTLRAALQPYAEKYGNRLTKEQLLLHCGLIPDDFKHYPMHGRLRRSLQRLVREGRISYDHIRGYWTIHQEPTSTDGNEDPKTNT